MTGTRTNYGPHPGPGSLGRSVGRSVGRRGAVVGLGADTGGRVCAGSRLGRAGPGWASALNDRHGRRNKTSVLLHGRAVIVNALARMPPPPVLFKRRAGACPAPTPKIYAPGVKPTRPTTTCAGRNDGDGDMRRREYDVGPMPGICRRSYERAGIWLAILGVVPFIIVRACGGKPHVHSRTECSHHQAGRHVHGVP